MTANVASFLKLSLGKETQISPEVFRSLGELGWEPVHGSYDFVYRWDVDWDRNGKNIPQQSDEVRALVETALNGYDIRYVFKTFQSAEKDES